MLGTVPNLGRDETRAAIAAAKEAFPAWAARTAKDRAGLLRRWHDLMIQHADDLAALMTAEQGKPLAEAKGEIVYAASFIEWFAEEGKRLYGDVIPGHQPDKRILVLRQPVGVVAAITPWNFPAAMITRKAGPALAAGCTFVCKPAMQTPFSALAMAELAHRAGIPRGVFSVITGKATVIGAEMTSNPLVRKLTFTGSTEIGKMLMAQCAGTMKKVSLELGGNAPFIVFDDADLDLAVQGAIASKYRNTGQTCVCANRLLVQEGVYDQFVAKLVDAVRKLRVGDGLLGVTEQGPLIDTKAVEKVEEHIADALAKGGQIALGGKRHALGGTFFEPTVITQVKPNMLMAREETFGPGGTGVLVQGRERSDPHGERHGVRPGVVFLYARPGEVVPCCRGARVRHRRAQYGAHLHRGRAVRRDKGVRCRSRGLQVRYPGLHRAQVFVHRWHRGLSDRALLLLLAAIITLGSIATNMYIPALPAVRAYFDAGVAEVQATFAVALVTFAVGILVWGPLSDRFGRRPTILAGIAIVAVGATIGLTAQSLGWLVVGRAVQAFGTSVGIAVSRAVVSDRYPPDRMARMLAQLGVVSVTANGLAPVLGGYLRFGLRLAFDLCGAAHRRRHRHDHRLAFFPRNTFDRTDAAARGGNGRGCRRPAA